MYWATSTDRRTPRGVDGAVTLAKYGSLMLGTGHTSSGVPGRHEAIDVEWTVAEYPTSPMPEPAGLAAVSRVIVSAAADLVTNVQRAVVGPANIRTARDNAWDATLADQARHQARLDLSREVAELVANRRYARRELAKTR